MRRFWLLLIFGIFLTSCVSASPYGDRIDNLKTEEVQESVDLSSAEKETFVYGTGSIKTNKQSDLAFSKDDNGINIEDNGNKHTIYDLRVSWSLIDEYVQNNCVQLTHINDAGIADVTWIQEVQNDGGYAYFEDVPFSEVIIGGFAGTYTKTGTIIYNTSQTFNFGTLFIPNAIGYINATITPNYTETSPYTIPTDGLVSWWKFDEGNGTYVNDSSGNNINGTIQNGMNFTTNGKYNNAGEFDNVNDQVTFTSELLKINNSMTYCCFVRPYGCTQGRLLYDPDGTVQNRNYMYWISTSYHPGIQVANTTGTSIVTSSLTVTQGEWNFVAFSINGTNMRVYVDKDSELLTLPYNITSMSNNTARIIGGTSASSVLNATMDNVIVYNRTLSDAEIRQIYYDGIYDLQLKTNSNNSYSSQLDESGILSIPFYSTDSNITSLAAYVPENITIGGVTIRQYNRSITPFTLATVIGYTENTTLIDENSNGIDSYTLNISFTPTKDYPIGGFVNYTTAEADILTADIVNVISDKSVTFDQSTGLFAFEAGALTAGQTYNYNVIVNWITTPVPNFSAGLVTGDVSLTTQFTDTSTNVPTSWLWNFGDGDTSIEQNPIHIYEEAGTYTVSLTTTNDAGSAIETKSNYIIAVGPTIVQTQISQRTTDQLDIVQESVDGLSISMDNSLYGIITDSITDGYQLCAILTVIFAAGIILGKLGYI